MWYRDLDTDDSIATATVAEFYECSKQTAACIVDECRFRYVRGDLGFPYSTEGVQYKNDYRLLRAIDSALNLPGAVDRFGGVDPNDLAQLFHDAWKEGIQRKDRVTVVLDSQSCDSCCGECGRSVPNGATECTVEGCDGVIHHSVLVTVSAPFAELWADSDQYIDGSTWETCGSDEIYTILSARPGLAAELEAEGYKLDHSEYCEDDLTES